MSLMRGRGEGVDDDGTKCELKVEELSRKERKVEARGLRKGREEEGRGKARRSRVGLGNGGDGQGWRERERLHSRSINYGYLLSSSDRGLEGSG